MKKDKKILAIIPARSGSKGLKDKNIKEFLSKPLMAHTIETAIHSNCFDKIIVSTDSEKYSEIAKNFGAEVPFLRSKENSQDKSGSWTVCKEVLDNLSEKFDIIVLLQPTSPLRKPEHIKEALDLYLAKNANTVVSVTPMSHPLQWCNTLPTDLSLTNFINEENRNKRRQDLEQSYTLNGSIYIVKSDLITDNLDIFGENSYAYIMEPKYSIDIDNELDFIIAETVAKNL